MFNKTKRASLKQSASAAESKSALITHLTANAMNQNHGERKYSVFKALELNARRSVDSELNG